MNKWWEQKNNRYFFEGEEVKVTLVVCDKCDGKGTTTNPAIDGDEDPEFLQDYTDGLFDITCNGNNFIPEPIDLDIQKRVAKWKSQDA